MRLTQHPLGHLEVTPKPSPAELSGYYANKYFRANQAGGYAHDYSAEEREGIESNLMLKLALVSRYLGDSAARTRISPERTIELYAALADLGLGRSINSVFRKPHP